MEQGTGTRRNKTNPGLLILISFCLRDDENFLGTRVVVEARESGLMHDSCYWYLRDNPPYVVTRT